MANKYWFSTGADAHWDTLLGNWWDDAAHTQQSAALPTTGDAVYLLGSMGPDAPPASPATLSRFDTSGLSESMFDPGLAVTAAIAIAAGGTLVMGELGGLGANIHNWAGDASAAASIAFSDGAFNSGTLGDNAVFSDQAGNGGTVADYAVFNDMSFNMQTVGGYATFNDAAQNQADVGDYATFNSGAFCGEAAAVGNYATFNESASCLGLGTETIGDHATFNDIAHVSAYLVGDNATFNDDSYATGTVTIGANATFNDQVGVDSSTIGDGATFNMTLPGTWQANTFTGTNYTITKPMDFKDDSYGNVFEQPAVTFVLAGPTATLAGLFLTADSLPVLITVEVAEPDCVAGNIRSGGTILGIPGTYDPLAAAVFPAEANVLQSAPGYGPTGSEYAGSFDPGRPDFVILAGN